MSEKKATSTRERIVSDAMKTTWNVAGNVAGSVMRTVLNVGSSGDEKDSASKSSTAATSDNFNFKTNLPIGEVSVCDPRKVMDPRVALTPHVSYSVRDANYGPMVERSNKSFLLLPNAYAHVFRFSRV
jgi:hypothetical protein